MKFLKQYGDCLGPLDFPMKDDDAKELEKRLDTGDFSPVKIQKSDAVESFLPNERGDVSIITDASIDKTGDVIDPDTIDWKTFQKNPIVTWNHNYNLPPAGRSIWQKRVAGGITKAKTLYPVRPEEVKKSEDWMPDLIWGMVKSHLLKGKSVGGLVKWDSPNKEDAERLHFDLNTVKRISRKAEIFEYACCPIGVNSTSVVEAISKSLINLPDMFINDFPDVFEALKKQVVDIPVIKSYRSSDDIKADSRREYKRKLAETKASLPQLVEDTFKRMLGKAE